MYIADSRSRIWGILPTHKHHSLRMVPSIPADPSVGLRHGVLGDGYECIKTIGQGAHGSAILANRIEDNEEVVVKQIHLAWMDEKARQEALKEVRLLSQFDHVNIVHYYECVLEEVSLITGTMLHAFNVGGPVQRCDAWHPLIA